MSLTPSQAGRFVALVGGLLLLGLVIQRAGGPDELLRALASMGWAWLVLVPLSLSWFLLNTWAWGRALPPPRPSLPVLLRVHLVAEAVNNVTPVFALGGEPLKIVLLAGRVPGSTALASVLADNLVHLLSAVPFVVVGLALGVSSHRLPAELVAPLVVVTAALGFLTLLLLRAVAGGAGARVLDRILRWRWFPERLASRLRSSATGVEDRLMAFLDSGTPFGTSLLAHLAGRFMGAVEAWVILAAIGSPVSPGEAVFVIAVVHVLVNLLFSFVPSQVGVQEAVAYALFAAIGLDPAAAVALSLVRRARGLLWIVVGLALLTVSGARSGTRCDETPEPR